MGTAQTQMKQRTARGPPDAGSSTAKGTRSQGFRPPIAIAPAPGHARSHGSRLPLRPLHPRPRRPPAEPRRRPGGIERALPRRACLAGPRAGQAGDQGPLPRRGVARRAGDRRGADPVRQDASPGAWRRRRAADLHRDRAQARLPLHRRGRAGRRGQRARRWPRPVARALAAVQPARRRRDARRRARRAARRAGLRPRRRFAAARARDRRGVGAAGPGRH